jgi:thiol-disulfide isomerase/thioredoxin
VLVTIAYVVGVGIPLFLVTYGGQQLVSKTRFFSQYTGRIQQIFGVVMLLTALAIYTNYDTYLQAQLLNAFPQFNTTLNSFESNSAITNQLNVLKGTEQNLTTSSELFNVTQPTLAPDFVGVSKWLNTDKPISIQNLKGKVVLVDFWTYTCINCIRTLPFVTSWYDKYHTDGFVVIGVHTPEFAFEHDTQNVLTAIKRYNIHYPVAQDNDYATWNNYQNQYWPAEYLIDSKGLIRRVEFGEGNYDKMEMAIQLLLKEAGKKVNEKIDTMKDQTPHAQLSPETYLGSSRMQYYYPTGNLSNGQQQFTLSSDLPENSFSYGGMWTIDNESATAGDKAMLNYNFVASNVYIILRPPTGSKGEVRIWLDGKIIDPSVAGGDVQNGSISVDVDRLYSIVDLHGKIENHTLKLEFLTPGTQAFTFTFG